MSQTMGWLSKSGWRVCETERSAAAKNQAHSSDQPKIILIDDDPTYGSVIRRWAEHEGVKMDVFHSLDDLGSVGLLAEYDIAIVDYDLGEINGKDVAEYMTILFGNKPMTMISGLDRTQELQNCPSCVKAFMNKSAGYASIVDIALKFHKKGER